MSNNSDLVPRRPKALLPDGLRAIIMAQYILSKGSNHDPEHFLQCVEESLSHWVVSSLFEKAKQSLNTNIRRRHE